MICGVGTLQISIFIIIYYKSETCSVDQYYTIKDSAETSSNHIIIGH